MKNLKMVVLFILSILTVPAFAAEYVVQPGDSLTDVAEFTHHSVEELSAMNEISNPNLIKVGQKLRWISEVDREYARSLCNRLSHSLEKTGEERYFFATQVIYLFDEKYSYKSGSNGIYFEDLFSYVQQTIVFRDKMFEDERQRLAILSASQSD